jgi:hypothetical protein
MISRNLYKDSRQLGGGLLDERENRLRKLALTVHFRTVAPSAPGTEISAPADKPPTQKMDFPASVGRNWRDGDSSQCRSSDRYFFA